MASAEPADVTFPATISGCIGYVGGGMFLGNKVARNVALLKALKITHVVAIAYPTDCCPAFQYKDKDSFEADAGKALIKVHNLTAYDDAEDDMLVEYRKVEAFLKKGTSGDNKTLVQCYFGQKRSPTLVALHLINDAGLTALESLLLILSVRLYIQPPRGFIRNMMDLERATQPKKTNSLAEADLPAVTVTSRQQIVPANREFFKAHFEYARNLRKKHPEPEETKLDAYKQCCFKDFEPIPNP